MCLLKRFATNWTVGYFHSFKKGASKSAHILYCVRVCVYAFRIFHFGQKYSYNWTLTLCYSEKHAYDIVSFMCRRLRLLFVGANVRKKKKNKRFSEIVSLCFLSLLIIGMSKFFRLIMYATYTVCYMYYPAATRSDG